MSGFFGTSAAQAALSLILNNVNWANLGDAAGVLGSTAPGSVYISLHTGIIAPGSLQTTNEAGYTSYARVAVARTGALWTVTGPIPAQGANASTITFPKATGGVESETYVALGRDAAGGGEILWGGPLLSPLAVSLNVQPTFPASTFVVTLG